MTIDDQVKLLYTLIQDISSDTRAVQEERKQEQLNVLKAVVEELQGEGGDLGNITEEQAISIANSIADITAPKIRLYGYDVVDWGVLKLIANDVSDVNLKDTGSSQIPYYLSSDIQLPLEFKCKKDFKPTLITGEYIYISYGDNYNYNGVIFKEILAGEVVASNIRESGYLQMQRINLGSDLVKASPYNFEFDNQTNEDISFFLSVQYGGKLVDGASESIQPYTNWDYVNPYWTTDLRNSSQNIILELWKADMSQLVYTQYGYAGNNYQGGNYMGQATFSNYNTRDYKVIVKYQ